MGQGTMEHLRSYLIGLTTHHDTLLRVYAGGLSKDTRTRRGSMCIRVRRDFYSTIDAPTRSVITASYFANLRGVHHALGGGGHDALG